MIGGSEDGMVFFWDLVDAKVVSKFRAHDLVVKIHSFSFFCFFFFFLLIPSVLILIFLRLFCFVSFGR